MKLTLGFSTCPNDTFIFDAMVNGKIDTEGLEFDYFLADVEELNKRAFSSQSDISKISYHAYAYISKHYLLLNSGSALGHNNGPLLVSSRIISKSDLPKSKIAIPGNFTTANLLLSIAVPDAVEKPEYLFSDIEDAIISGEVDAGVLIHENRFTYEARGLLKILDLGEYWEDYTGLPIPLGGIAIKRTIPKKIALTVDRVLARSIEYAFNNPSSSYEFIKRFAVSMDRKVMESHINLYVNEYTINLGKRGKDAVGKLFREARIKGILPRLQDQLFVS